MSDVRVTQEQINELLENSKIEAMMLGEKTTAVIATLPCGFSIVQTSSCVDPENYNHELGKKICLKRIEDKLWELEGYRLQTSLSK